MHIGDTVKLRGLEVHGRITAIDRGIVTVEYSTSGDPEVINYRMEAITGQSGWLQHAEITECVEAPIDSTPLSVDEMTVNPAFVAGAMNTAMDLIEHQVATWSLNTGQISDKAARAMLAITIQNVRRTRSIVRAGLSEQHRNSR